MVAQVERKPRGIQASFSWGVAAVLALALLVGIGVAAAQVRARDATIADQATSISRQATALQQSGEQVLSLRRIAALDESIIEAYGQVQAQRLAMEQALRGEFGEVYESHAVAAAGA